MKFEIEGQKAKTRSQTVQSSQEPLYEDNVVVKLPNPDADVLVIRVLSKELGRDEILSNKVKIPVKAFLPFDKNEDRVLNLKRKKKGVGKLYLKFVLTP